MKMSTILKTLNSPKKKRKAVAVLRAKQAEEEIEIKRRQELAAQKTYKKYANPDKRKSFSVAASQIVTASRPLGSELATDDNDTRAPDDAAIENKDEKHVDTER
jgi:hypothetical protein